MSTLTFEFEPVGCLGVCTSLAEYIAVHLPDLGTVCSELITPPHAEDDTRSVMAMENESLMNSFSFFQRAHTFDKGVNPRPRFLSLLLYCNAQNKPVSALMASALSTVGAQKSPILQGCSQRP